MHKASFCLQAEKSVHLNNYVSSYPARNPECPHDRRRECRKETPASGISLVRNCSLRRDRKVKSETDMLFSHYLNHVI